MYELATLRTNDERGALWVTSLSPGQREDTSFFSLAGWLWRKNAAKLCGYSESMLKKQIPA
jgi:hypothetical protein